MTGAPAEAVRFGGGVFISTRFCEFDMLWTVLYRDVYVGKVEADTEPEAFEKAREGDIQWKGSIPEDDPPEVPKAEKIHLIPF